METITHYWQGTWHPAAGALTLPVHDPGTGELLGHTPVATAQEVGQAVKAAQAAYIEWRSRPVTDRVQPLFRLKALLEEHLDRLARTITIECGKTLAESKGEMRRAIENVEVACGMPTMMQSAFSENVAPGIDEFSIRQPLGVCAIICPFNFPAMIPYWFLPYAAAAGNTVVVKPSERVPLTMQQMVPLFEQAGFPPGVINLLHGDRTTSEALISHPDVRAVSFVGSSAGARAVYAMAGAHGKRVQCQGGAKNPVVILPDADPETTTQIVADSAFGCAGQRCLAASVAVLVDDEGAFRDRLREAAASRATGYGLNGVQMGPVISEQSKHRVHSLIGRAEEHGAKASVDGRNPSIDGYEKGNFVRPTVLEQLPPGSDIMATEIFGPVLTVLEVKTIEQAIAFVNQGSYGNMACLFTSSGDAARKFRSEAQVGNVGINIGVAAPMAFFPFSGARESFFGDLHGQAKDAVRFFTQEKVVVERWPRAWSRTF